MNKIFIEFKSFELNKRNKIRSNRFMYEIIQSAFDYKPRIIFELLVFVFKLSYDFSVKAQKHPNASRRL